VHCEILLSDIDPSIMHLSLDKSLELGSTTYGPRAGSGRPGKIIRPAIPLQTVTVCPA